MSAFETTDALIRRLWSILDRVLTTLEVLRRYLMRKLIQALEWIDAFKDRLLAIARALFRLFLITLPPLVGIVVLFGFYFSVPLLIMTAGLTLMLVYVLSDNRKREVIGPPVFPIVNDATRAFGVGLATVLLLIAYLFNTGLFIGIILFIAEFSSFTLCDMKLGTKRSARPTGTMRWADPGKTNTGAWARLTE